MFVRTVTHPCPGVPSRAGTSAGPPQWIQRGAGAESLLHRHESFQRIHRHPRSECWSRSQWPWTWRIRFSLVWRAHASSVGLKKSSDLCCKITNPSPKPKVTALGWGAPDHSASHRRICRADLPASAHVTLSGEVMRGPYLPAPASPSSPGCTAAKTSKQPVRPGGAVPGHWGAWETCSSANIWTVVGMDVCGRATLLLWREETAWPGHDTFIVRFTHIINIMLEVV